MMKHYRLAVARAMCLPAVEGLSRLKQPVDTLILGDSVARVNLNAGQWHDMGLGDVLNLGNSSVSGCIEDVIMLNDYLSRFKPPARVVVVRHYGAFLDDVVQGFLLTALQPLAELHLKLNGKWPSIPVVNDYSPKGLNPDPELVTDFVRLRPRWLVGPWALAPGNKVAMGMLASTCKNYRIKLTYASGPTCRLVAREALAMRSGWIQALSEIKVNYICDNLLYHEGEMQDPNHLSPKRAEDYSWWMANSIKERGY